MAKPILVANWKNHPDSLPRANSLLSGLGKRRLLFKKLSLFIAPPAPYLGAVSDKAKSFGNLASQDIFAEAEGKRSYTGYITPEILKSFGVKLAVIGHSERRALGEVDEDVARKVKTALKAGITPLVCVGEKEWDKDGEHLVFLFRQIKNSLEGLKKNDAHKIAIAYEPVWTIGKSAKDAISPADLSQSVIFIKKVLTDLFGRQAADKIPVLYGGSVEPANAEHLYHETDVRGFLVGHESLDAEDLAEIAEAMIQK